VETAREGWRVVTGSNNKNRRVYLREKKQGTAWIDLPRRIGWPALRYLSLGTRVAPWTARCSQASLSTVYSSKSIVAVCNGFYLGARCICISTSLAFHLYSYTVSAYQLTYAYYILWYAQLLM